MKPRLIATIPLAMFLAACHQGHVGIQTAKSADEVSVNKTARTQFDKSETKTSQPMVYFTDVGVYKNRVDAVKGIGFLPEKSETTKAFSIALPARPAAQGLQIAYARKNGSIFFAKRNDSGHDVVSSTNVSSMESKDLFTPETVVRSLKGFDEWLAWIDQDGDVTIMRDGDQKVFAMNVPGFSANELQFTKTGALVVAGSRSGKTEENIVFELKRSPRVVREIYSSRVALSASESYIAFVAPDAGSDSLQIKNQNEPESDAIEITKAAKGSVRGFAWAGDRFLAYWISTAENKGQIFVADIKKETTTKLTDLTLPQAPQQEIVCPAWSGTTLYFSNTKNGKLSVFKSARGSRGWLTTTFAEPVDSSTGYVCPQTAH